MKVAQNVTDLEQRVEVLEVEVENIEDDINDIENDLDLQTNRIDNVEDDVSQNTNEIFNKYWRTHVEAILLFISPPFLTSRNLRIHKFKIFKQIP